MYNFNIYRQKKLSNIFKRIRRLWRFLPSDCVGFFPTRSNTGKLFLHADFSRILSSSITNNRITILWNMGERKQGFRDEEWWTWKPGKRHTQSGFRSNNLDGKFEEDSVLIGNMYVYNMNHITSTLYIINFPPSKDSKGLCLECVWSMLSLVRLWMHTLLGSNQN